MPTITLCIINHNGVGYLRHALTAIEPFVDQFDEVLVIDNASTDDSVAYARSVNGVSVAQLPRNLGPGAARNLGFKLARNDLILFQDNDICLGPDAALELTGVILQYERTLIAAPRVVYRDHPEIIQYDSADCHLLCMMAVRHANTKVSDVPAQTQCTSSLVTACFMIHRQRWHDGLLFDERLFFNLEDHDLGVRANLLGHDVVSVAKVSVLHGGGTAGLSWRPGYTVPLRRMFYLVRNRWWIMIRYFSLGTLLKLLPLLLLFESFQLAGVVQKGFWREWLQAFGSTVLYLPLLLRQRRHYQRLRRKPDMAILRGGPLPLTTAMTSGRMAAWAIRLFETILDRYVGKIFPQLNRQ